MEHNEEKEKMNDYSRQFYKLQEGKGRNCRRRKTNDNDGDFVALKGAAAIARKIITQSKTKKIKVSKSRRVVRNLIGPAVNLKEAPPNINNDNVQDSNNNGKSSEDILKNLKRLVAIQMSSDFSWFGVSLASLICH